MALTRVNAGFWSYVHQDDDHESGRITRLLERLERSIRFFSGNREFRIFQDRKDIGWGEKWAQRITNSLDDALLLFPIVTPSYLSSAPCKEEALSFQKRQVALGRADLILPIYYLTTDDIETSDQGELEPTEREVAALVRAHQYEDWRALRETSETDPAYGQAIERLARRAVDALKRGPASNPTNGAEDLAPAGTATSQQHEQIGSSSMLTVETTELATVSAQNAAGSLPGHVVTLTVNPMPGRAQFTTISEAVARAPGGARILISPGHYRESVTIDKPLELIGDGPREDIILEAQGPEPLIFDTNIGVVRNLTLRMRQETPEDYCVWIMQGRLELEDCDLSSTGRSCLAVTDNADPRVRRNHIHDSNEGGIVIYNNGRGTYEDNEIFGNSSSGISVSDGAEPVVRRNRIHDGKQAGISIYDSGRGIYEDNEIFGNGLAGITVRSDSNPVVRRNKIYDGKQSGLFVHTNGRGTYEDNDVFGNVLAGLGVKTGADPVVRRNRFYNNGGSGVFIYDAGKGNYEENEIFGNSLAGIEVKTGAEPILKRNRIHGGKQSGVYVHHEGLGVFDDNEVVSNRSAGFWIGIGGNPTARRNRVTENVKAAIKVVEGGAGVFEDNDLRESPGEPWDIHPSAAAQVTRKRNRAT